MFLLTRLAIVFSLFWGASAFAQDAKPIDIFNSEIDGQSIFEFLERSGSKLIDDQPENAVERLHEQLGSASGSKTPTLDSLAAAGKAKESEAYRHMVKSNVIVGRLYDCGKCDKTHVSCAGGVMVSETGLMLTNHHVLRKRDESATQNVTLGYLAMTSDGKCFAIDKILMADENSDVALVQLKSDGHRFFAAPIAKRRPDPTTHIRILSHPSGQFFVLCEGEVSRYTATPRKGRDSKQHWMEITAEFGFGSSGSGVFNNEGEIVGLVSRVFPLKQSYQSKQSTSKSSLGDMILRRCVPLKRIHQCFGNQGPAEKAESGETGENTESQKAKVAEE